MPDIITRLAGLSPGHPVDALRDLRPQARAQAQASHDALFAPADPGAMPLLDRWAVALYIAGLHRAPTPAAHYEAGLRAAGGSDALVAALARAAASAATTGPFGAYPPGGPLVAENSTGTIVTIADPAFSPRLAAALDHAHMLVFHPRDAAPAHLQALLDAGWTTDGIVTLSQLVSFLAFQIRVISGLAALAGASS